MGFSWSANLGFPRARDFIEMKEHDFNEVVSLILKEDDRYAKESYVFLKRALDFTMDQERKKQGLSVSKQRHVSGQELLTGMRDYATEQFGPLAFTVLTSWGLKRCEDIGEMVFNLIDYGVFSKNEDDTREDFSSIYDFGDAFVKPYQPKRRILKRPRYRAIESL